MRKLRDPQPAAKLRKKAELTTKFGNTNGSSSTAVVLRRYRDIFVHFTELKLDRHDSIRHKTRRNLKTGGSF